MANDTATIPVIPFTSAAHEHVEPAFTETVTPGTSTQQINQIDIPAAGYFRYLFLQVEASGGAGGTLADDGPWNLFNSITLQDVNGATIFGPMDGFAAYVTNLAGGYAARQNPIDSPVYVGSAPNPTFYLRIPLEIRRKDGLGSLANQNSASNYKLSISINTIAAMTSTAWTTTPEFTIKGFLEAWTLPAPTDVKGRPQAQVPPLLGTGQYWSSRTQSGIIVGDNTIPLTRLGNFIRSLVFIARDASGDRTDDVFPDPFRLEWDGITIRSQSQFYSQQEFYEKTFGEVTRPTGVFVIPFNHGGSVASLGDEEPDLWLPTTQSSRIEIRGSSGTAGTVQTLTNEVAPIEQSANRYVEPTATGSLANPNVTV